MKNIKKHFAFTMVEMVFVVVVLGIVAAIGSGIIAKIYESYIYSRNINNLQTKTELALTQISRLLSFRVRNSTIARLAANSSNIVSLPMADLNYKILEWIGYDNEGFEGNVSGPGWSGLIDLNNPQTNKTQVETPGSHLSYAEDIINALSYGDVNLSAPNSSVALIFKGLPNRFDIKQYGWDDWNGTINHDYIFRVKRNGSDILKFVENNATTVYEQYQLAWSAYAIVPEGSTNDSNLTFYYNYRPWMGEKYSDGNKSTLMKHVSTFKFRQIGSTIRLKLCVFNPVGNDFNITFCKEKVVF